MELEGKVWKSKRYWLVEVPSLDLMTQGKTKKDALFMIKDAVEELIYSYFPKTPKGFEVVVHDYKKGVIGVSSKERKLLISLLLKRQREKSQTSIREASERLGSKSPNAYAQYERGKTNISLDKLEELLEVVNPENHSQLRVV